MLRYNVVVLRTDGNKWVGVVDDRQEAMALCMVVFGFAGTKQVEVWHDGDKLAQLPLPMAN